MGARASPATVAFVLTCTRASRTGPQGEETSMRPDRMTTKSREAFQSAIDRASRAGNPELQPEHLVAAMLDQEGGVASPILQKAGIDVAETDFGRVVIGLDPRVVVRKDDVDAAVPRRERCGETGNGVWF